MLSVLTSQPSHLKRHKAIFASIKLQLMHILTLMLLISHCGERVSAKELCHFPEAANTGF